MNTVIGLLNNKGRGTSGSASQLAGFKKGCRSTHFVINY